MPEAAVSTSRPATVPRDRAQSQLGIPGAALWAFGAAIACTYLMLLGSFGLAEPDEPRYGEIAREMIELGDWVTPHLNYVKYFEKPPLVYWLTACNVELFGISEFVIRLWPAIFGLIGIAVAYVLARSLYGRWTGAVAAAVLATTPLFFGLSQIVILDMPLSALMALGLAAFWFAYSTPGRVRALLVVLLYVATALGVLTKGPVAAILTGGIIVFFLILRRDFGALRWLISPLGLVAFVAIAAPWFILVSRRNPEFLDFFIVDQHLKRFLTPNEHQQGPWFFLPIVWGGMLPWSLVVLFAPRALWNALVRVVRLRVSPGTLFCAIWSGIVFLFFSLSGSKLATYVLPLFCPLAILVARFLRDLFETEPRTVLHRSAVALLVLAGITAIGGTVAQAIVEQPEMSVIGGRIYVGAAVIAATAVAALVLVRRRRYQASVAAVVLGMLVLQLIAISGRAVVAEYRHLGLTVRQQARPQDLVIVYNHYVQGIPFYARRRVVMVGGHGELDFGSRQGDQSAFFWPDDDQLIRAWQSPRRVFLVINRLELERLLPRLRPAPRQIAQQGKKVLIVNFSG